MIPKQVKIEASKTNNIFNEDDKVYIVDQGKEGGWLFNQMRFLIAPIKTNLLYEWKLVNSNFKNYYEYKISPTDFIEKIKNENYNYVYIIRVDNRFIEEYKGILTEDVKMELICRTMEKVGENYYKGIVTKLNDNNLLEKVQ